MLAYFLHTQLLERLDRASHLMQQRARFSRTFARAASLRFALEKENNKE